VATELTPEGLSIETYEELRDDVVSRLRSDVSATVNAEEDALLGNLVSIVCTKYREGLEALEAVYESLDPDGNTGASQDHIAAITGTTREAATHSTVTATVEVEPGTYAVGDLVAHVVNDPTARFANTQEVVNAGPADATADVIFQAEDTGPIAAPSGTLTAIAGAVAGWLSVTNAEDAELGRAIELDSELRARREDELSGSGSATVDAIRAHILRELPDVTSCIVLENTTDAVDSNGLPAHSIEVIVLAPGVPAADIAAEVWASKPGGIYTHGDEEVVVTDSQGIEHTVRFSYQTDVDIYVRFGELEVIEESYVGDTEFIADFVEAGNAYYTIGRDVKRSKLTGLAQSITGVFGVDLDTLETSLDGVSWAASNRTVGIRERARLDTSRVLITLTTNVEE
jgi:uncharacterized phage protein gp47/JayE